MVENDSYKIFFEHSIDAILLTEPDGSILAANPAACQLFDRTEEEIISLGRDAFIDMSDPNVEILLNERKLYGKARGEINLIKKNGTVFPAEISTVIFFDKCGKQKSSVIIRDITERKKTEKELEESRERLRFALEGTNDGLWDFKLDCGKYYLSPRGNELLGYPKEITFEKWTDLIHPDDYQPFTEKFLIHLEGRSSYFETEHRLRTITGEYKWMLTRGKVVAKNESGNPIRITGTISDISDRKKAEEEIRENEEKNRKLIESSIDAILINENNVVTYANESAVKLYAAENADQLIGKTSYELTHFEMHPKIDEGTELAVVDKSKMPIIEGKIIQLNGNIVSVEATALPFTFKGHDLMFVTLRDISERKKNEEILKQQNEKYFALNLELLESNRRIQEINQELLVAKEKAQESDRLKTVFLQNMSHEIRTPMNAIMGFSDLLCENFDHKSKLEKFTTIIKQRSSDLLSLINEILDLSKIETGQLPINIEEFELNDLFLELNEFFIIQRQKINKTDIKLYFTPTKGIIVRTDKNKVKQIFINLIYNAFKFTEKGEIKFGLKSIRDNQFEFFVSDTGIGIPKDKHKVVFERFQQLNTELKNNLGGTGLGLSIVKGLVDLLGGNITLQSEPGFGSAFSFTLPFSTSNQTFKPKNEEAFDIQKNNFENITILIVEDDIFNMELLKETLSHTFLQIKTCFSAEDSIEIVKNEKVDLILMDIRLGNMNGLKATRIIKAIKPNIKIIAQTAYASDTDRQNALDAGCDDYISKPIKKEKLMQLINKQVSNLEF